MIREANQNDLDLLALLASELWDGHETAELKKEFEKLLSSPDAHIFLSLENQMPVGFAQCQLRHDYVEGAHSSPVGYLEGVYVREKFRRKGYGRDLVRACEQWTIEKGCREFASDCEASNENSFLFHRAIGFCEANRIICFTKSLLKSQK